MEAWFATDDVAVVPGSRLTLALAVHNLDPVAHRVTIIPAGLRSGWVVIDSQHLTIEPGAVETVDVVVAPSRSPATPPGATPVAIRILLDDGSDGVLAETTVDVAEYDERRILPLQSVVRARRRASYEFMVENDGNAVASCRLLLVDATDRIDGSFDPPAVGVPPGDASLVRLRAVGARSWYRRSDRRLDFEVAAQQPGHQTALTSFSLVQPRTLPAGLLAWTFGALALVGAVVAAWFGLIRPEIRDAAAREVDQQLADRPPTTLNDGSDATVADADEDTDGTDGPTDAVTPTSTDPGTSTTIATAPAEPAATAGEPDFYRLKVEPPITQTADASFTVPPGQVFDMTDVRVENPFDDAGLATLLVNGEEVFVWSLQNIRGSQFEPAITQRRLQAGDNVTFSVRCDSVGDPFRGTCSDAVNVGGRVITDSSG